MMLLAAAIIYADAHRALRLTVIRVHDAMRARGIKHANFTIVRSMHRMPRMDGYLSSPTVPLLLNEGSF